MYILDIWGEIRGFLVYIDSVAYDLIDNMYNLIVAFASGRFFEDDTIESVAKSLYIVISIFALFRLAVLLINSIISPDKMEDKETGLSSIFRNFIIMFVILAMAPTAFRELFDLQDFIVRGNYVERLLGEKVTENGTQNNPGEEIKYIAVSAMIHPDSKLAKREDSGYYQYDESICDSASKCQDAIIEYNRDILGLVKNEKGDVVETTRGDLWQTLHDHMGNFTKNPKIYVYNYHILVTFAVGIAITYLLLTFALDIAIRLIKIAVLELLSPLFIVTYADPKMAKSGPFHNWLSEYGKAYLSLFIRLGVLAILILLINHIEDVFKSEAWDGIEKGIPKLILLFAILIFAKQLPGWISGLIGLKDDGLKGGGFFKKLGEAALIGGMVKKAMDSGKSKGKEALKRHAGNVRDRKIRGLGARAGVLSEKGVKAFKPRLAKTNRKIAGIHIPYLTTDLARASRAERRNLKAEQKENAPISKTREDFVNSMKNVNPNYKSLRDKSIEKLKGKANISLEAALSEGVLKSASELAKIRKELENQKNAKIYSSSDLVLDSDGFREKTKILDSDGKLLRSGYTNPSDQKEFDEAIGFSDNGHDAFSNYGELLAQKNGVNFEERDIIVNGKTVKEKVMVKDGNIVNGKDNKPITLADYGAEGLNYEGRLMVQERVAAKVANNLSNYQQVLQQAQSISNTLTDQTQQFNNTVTTLQQAGHADLVQKAQEYRMALSNVAVARELKAMQDSGVVKLTPDQIKIVNNLSSLEENAKNKKSEVISLESSAGVNVTPIIENISGTQERLNQYVKEQQRYEKIFKSANNTIVYDESGKPKRDGAGNIVTENPYVQTVGDQKYDPIKDSMHLAEMISSAQTKQSKAESKAKKALEEAQKKGTSGKGDGK